MASHVTMSIEPPPFYSSSRELPSPELSVQKVSDFVETKMSKPNGIADVITSGGGKSLNFSLISIDSDRDLNRSYLVNGWLQYHVNEARQKLRHEEKEIETVSIELPYLDILLGDDSVRWDSCLIKWKFEYSGDSSLIKSCSAFGCKSYGGLYDPWYKEEIEKLKIGEGQPDTEDIRSSMDMLLHWILACLRLALSLYPLVEEIVREHVTIRDILISSPSGKAQFHCGKDAIDNIRRHKKRTSSSGIMKKMIASPFKMKFTMWFVPFLQGCDCIFKTCIFGVATVDNGGGQVKNETEAFFDEDTEQVFTSMYHFHLGNPPLSNKVVEVEMTKIMKEMPPSTAEVNVTWLFNDQDRDETQRDQIYLNH